MSTRTFPFVSGRNACAGTGLTEAECSVVARSARDLPGIWWVQHDVDDRGYTSLGLISDDDGAPVFLLWRENGSVCLACGQGEFYVDLGGHAGVASAMTAARRALGAAEEATRWVEVACPAPAGPRPPDDSDSIARRLADWAEDARLAWEVSNRSGHAPGRRPARGSDAGLMNHPHRPHRSSPAAGRLLPFASAGP